MNKEQLSTKISQILEEEMAGSVLPNRRRVIATRVEIEERDRYYSWGGCSILELHIDILTESPKGRNKKWEKYYLD